MKVERQLPSIGVLIGSAEATKVKAIAAVAGVADVEEQGTNQLPPPDVSAQ